MRLFRVLCGYLMVILMFSGCKERFDLELEATNTRLLVVEGLINTGVGGQTIIKLSRTTPAAASGNTIVAETGAQIAIESDDNQSYPLVETGSGTYKSASLNLLVTKKYRLKITSKNRQYTSDYVEVKSSPPISEVTWEVKPNGVQLYVSTEDPTNEARYYRWDFEDTWIFNANYQSLLIWNGTGLRARNWDTEDIYKCFMTSTSTSIVVGSSIKLANDIIDKQPLAFIPLTSEKFTEKYSVLVKQYALTKEAFSFWDNLRKNTESLGTIFDAQPSQLIGNIRNINDPNEKVLGYISAGSIQTRRIFIDRTQLPDVVVSPSLKCNPEFTVDLNNTNLFADPRYLPIGELLNDVGQLIGYRGIVRECADCTLRGTKTKPDFWP